MHEFPFYYLYNTNLNLFNINWHNLIQYNKLKKLTLTFIQN